MARIRMAKSATGAAFISNKKRAEERRRAEELGLTTAEEGDGLAAHEDVFEMQHHHLLSCLERVTVSCGRLRHLGGVRMAKASRDM